MKLIIVGAGKMAQLAFQAFANLPWPGAEYIPAVFAVEAKYIKSGHMYGVPIISLEGLRPLFPRTYEAHAFHVAVSYRNGNADKTRLYKLMKEWGYKPASYIAPSAVVGRTAMLGEHHFISPLNNIDEYATLGDNVYLHAHNHIGHHSTIGDNVFIASGVTISGNCKVGANTFIGVNACVADGVTIGEGCIIGAGTYISRDIADGALVRRSSDRPDTMRTAKDVTL